MRKAPSETNGFEGFFAEGLRKAQAAFHVRGKSMHADDAAVHEAVQAGAMAGAYAGAVAGAMAGAMSARRGGVASIFRSPGKASSEKKEEPVSGLSRSGSHQPPAEPPSPQRTIPRNPSAGAFSTASGEGDEHDLELELAKTLTIDEYITKSGVEQHIEEPKEITPSPPKRQPSMYQPSLYEKNTDIDDEEEVDPRVGLTLDRMNDAGDDVNNKELALTRAKRGAQKIQGDERKRCQDAYDKLPKVIKEILPYLHKQALVQQQQGKAQKAFVEYQVAHDVHAAAKAAVKEIEPQLMAVAGRSSVDTELLERYSDCCSKVVEAEADKLKADKQHALEARRLANLLKELKESKQFLTKEHVMAAQPYFAVKTRAEDAIKASVENIVAVEKELHLAKRVYQEAMDELDRISVEIHEKRQEDKRRRERELERRQRESLDRRRAAEEKAQVEEAAESAAAQVALAVQAAMSLQPGPSDAAPDAAPPGGAAASVPDLAAVRETAAPEQLFPSRSEAEQETAEPAAASSSSEPAAAGPAAEATQPAPAAAEPAPVASEPAPAAPAPAAEAEPDRTAVAEAPSEPEPPLAHSSSAQYASAQSELSDMSEEPLAPPPPPPASTSASETSNSSVHILASAQPKVEVLGASQPPAAEPEAEAPPALASQSAPADPDAFDFSEQSAAPPSLPPPLLSAESAVGVVDGAEAAAESPIAAPENVSVSFADSVGTAAEELASPAPAATSRGGDKRRESDPFGIHAYASPAEVAPKEPQPQQQPAIDEDLDLC